MKRIVHYQKGSEPSVALCGMYFHALQPLLFISPSMEPGEGQKLCKRCQHKLHKTITGDTMSTKPKLPSRKILYQEIAAAINTRDLSQILSADTLTAYPDIEARNVMRRVVADVATYCLETAHGVKEDVW